MLRHGPLLLMIGMLMVMEGMRRLSRYDQHEVSRIPLPLLRWIEANIVSGVAALAIGAALFALRR